MGKAFREKHKKKRRNTKKRRNKNIITMRKHNERIVGIKPDKVLIQRKKASEKSSRDVELLTVEEVKGSKERRLRVELKIK